MTADQSVIQPNGTSAVTALMSLSCAKLSAQNVSFSVSGPGKLLAGSDVSDAAGKATTTMTSTGAEGRITVTAVCSMYWYTKRVIVNGQTQSATKQTETITKSVDIMVVKNPSMTLMADATTIQPGGTANLSGAITNNSASATLGDQMVSFLVSGPATLSASSGTASQAAPATTRLTAGSDEGTATVTATCNAILALAGGGTITVPLTSVATVTISKSKAFHVVTDYAATNLSGPLVISDQPSLWHLTLDRYSLHFECDTVIPKSLDDYSDMVTATASQTYGALPFRIFISISLSRQRY